MNIPKKLDALLDLYYESLDAIYKYFGYSEGFQVFPIQDHREYYWMVDEDAGKVYFADDKSGLPKLDEYGDLEEADEGYSGELRNSVYLDSAIYRKEDYTMMVVDTNCDNNIFLMIFANDNEVPMEDENEE